MGNACCCNSQPQYEQVHTEGKQPEIYESEFQNLRHIPQVPLGLFFSLKQNKKIKQIQISNKKNKIIKVQMIKTIIFLNHKQLKQYKQFQIIQINIQSKLQKNKAILFTTKTILMIKNYLFQALMNLKTGLYIQVNGKTEIDMVKGHNIGQTVVYMKDIGKIICQKEKEDQYMQMEMSIQEIGKKIKRMVLGFICILIMQNMKGNGLMINNMGKELSPGLMGLFLQGNILKVKRKGKVLLNGLMGLFMKEILIIIKFMGLGNIFGRIIGHMKVSGNSIKWKVKEFLIGLMGKIIKGNIQMIKDMGMGFLNGQMENLQRIMGIRQIAWSWAFYQFRRDRNKRCLG
ncbi:hypothetical protein IMG5_005720 [Ichthyophthirius multifiliis]|uniref:Uncharacterized protein n=1 Tax=Ichthyophthirius multifiliis TaxID=5932 RepID=G0QJJ0_ICHMU|nr:hypothetical protein IMG5_005720 [Ichthyophthirius multifiliis]EGR34617.1 hypothetical protein IMG5_005720 [Ichthyophthirius multifiliis]|eukprot:XP_004039921.1 hypothetical protein IMG5_005720 [Ichthyophthirius multifiliis]